MVGKPPRQEVLRASISVLGSSFTTATVLEFVSGTDPYFTNINPALNNPSWLSQELVAFTATPGRNAVPVPGGPTFGTNDVNGAYEYIKALVEYFNKTYNDPTGTDPFSSTRGVIPQQGQALTNASSITPAA